MQENSGKNIVKNGDSSNILGGVSLPNNVVQILDKTHSGISDIVDIRLLEYQETNLFAIFGRAWKDRIYSLLGINNIDPIIFAQITETLNASRKAINEKQEFIPGKHDKIISINLTNKDKQDKAA